MATTTTYTIGGGLEFDGKKTVTVPRSYTPTSLDAASLAGLTYEDAKGKTVTIKSGAITDINASDLRTPITIIGGTGTAKDDKDDKAVSVTLGSSKSAGGLVTGGGKSDKFYGGDGKDTFAVDAGDQVGNDPKKTATELLYGTDDVISINAKFSELAFNDAPNKQSVTITDASKKKYTIYKQSVDTPLTIVDSTDGSFHYGTDGSNSVLDPKGKEVTISSGSGTIDVSTIAAGAKIIDATKVTASGGVYLIGNGQADNISIGSTGGTLYGGYNYDPAKKTTKATADNLYGTSGTGAVTFYIDSLAGSDNVYNYKQDDTISVYVKDAAKLDFTNNKVLKDGGAGKDVVLTYDGKNKVTIKQNTADLITFDLNGTIKQYGVDFSDVVTGTNADAGLNAKRTAITLGGAAIGTVGIQGWSNSGYTGVATDTALSLMAPKLNEIDASAATGTNVSLALNAHPTVASVLRGAAGGNTTMYGGTGNDQFYGGAGHDVLVFDVSTLTGGKYTAIGKDVVNNIEAGDLIMLKGYTDGVHTAVQVDSKGVVYLTDDKTDQKTNSITVKTFKPGRNATEQPVVVIDDTGKILAVNSFSGAPAPIGATLSSKSGLVTGSTFNGQYKSDAYVVGATLDVASGKVTDVNSSNQLDLDGTAATIDAASYGGALKAIDARNVSSALTNLYIKGNETTKNTIYAPTLVAGNDAATLNVTLEGGTGADTFNRDSDATKVAATYVFDATGYDAKASKPKVTFGKDIISNYVEGDTIEIALPASASVTSDSLLGSFLEGKITEKNSDVIVTLDKSNILTIKDAATKAIHFKSGTYEYNYGYTLPSGLEYDKKHTAINAVTLAAGDPNAFGGTLNLRTGHYYAGVKTVSLTGSTVDAYVYGSSTNANEIYAGTGDNTLFGGSVLNMTTGEGSKKKALKATADKLYGNTGSDTFVYMEGEGADVIGNTKGNNAHTLFQDHDKLILASNNSSALTRDNVTITDKNNTLTITIGTTKDKFTVNKADANTTVNISLVPSIDAEGNYSLATDATPETFTYGMNEKEFAGSLDTKKGVLEISGGGTNYTDASTVATLASAELRNVASNIKNVSVTAGSNTAVNIIGDQRNGNALTINMGLGGGTVEGSAKVKINEKKADALTASGYEETFTGNKDSIILNTAATKGTTFVLSSISGADQITNYDASRGDVIYFKDPIDNVTVIRSGKGIQFDYIDSKTKKSVGSVIINAKNADDNFNVNIEGKTSGATPIVLSGKYYGWDTKPKKLVDLKDKVRDTSWDYSNGTYTYDNGTAKFTLTSGSLQDTDGNYIPDGVSVTSDNKLDFSGVKNYINPLVGEFHATGTGITEGAKFTINSVEYTLYEADGNSLNGLELTANGFVKTDSSRVVYYGAENNGLNKDALFTLTGAFADKGGQMETVVNGTTTTEAEVTRPYLNQFTYNGTDHAISIGVDSDTATPLNAHIVLSDDAAQDNFSLKVGTTNTYKLYDGNGDTTDGYEFLRTDLADAAKWTLLTGSADTESQQANGTGVWKFDDENTTNKLQFLVSAEDSLKPDPKGLPDGVTVTTSDTLTSVTFDNDFALAGNGFAKFIENKSDSFIYYGSLSSDGETVVDYKTYDVGGTNQFTLSGLVDDWDIPADFAKFAYSNNTLSITGSTNTTIANFDQFTKAHVTFSKYFAEDVANDSLSAIGEQRLKITFGAGNKDTGTFKLYDGDGNAENGYEIIRTDAAAEANWTLLTGVSNDKRVTDRYNYVYQSNGTGFWNYDNSSATNGYGFVVSSEAGVKHATDGTPIGISVGASGNEYTITIDSTSGIAASHILFNDGTKFGTETGAVHIAGYEIGTEFTHGEDTYQLADLDRDSSNGHELLKIDPAGGWSISEGVWSFDNKTIKNATYTVADSIDAVQFAIDSDASLAIGADGYPIGVTVEADRTSKGKTLGKVKGIFFGNNSLAFHVSFKTLPTGDISATSHIIRLNSGTSEVPTFTMADEKDYYLVNLDSDSSQYEFLAKNDNWLRTKEGWSYFADSSTMAFDAAADIAIVAAGEAIGTVRAALDGSPRGISITTAADTSDTYITIDSSTGVINTSDTVGKATVRLTPAQLSFATTTKVNDVHGLHILTADATTAFEIGDTLNVGRVANNAITQVPYELANLDRDASNGFELIAVNDVGWHFNSGITSNTRKTDVLGSWTYNSGTTVGTDNASVGTLSQKSFTFNISEAASLFGGNDTLGTPKGVTITLGTAEKPGATIDASAATGDTDAGFNLAYFKFDSVVAEKTFLSDTGLHFVGFNEGDQLTVDFGTVQGAATTSTKVYRLAELSGKSADGLELLYTADPQYWSVTADSMSGARTWTYSNNLTGIASLVVADTADLISAADGGTPQGITITGGASEGVATISVDSAASLAATNNASLKAADFAFTVSGAQQLGSGGTLHLVGFDTGTTLSVNGETYELANMDTVADDYELLKKDDNWQFYSQNATLNAANPTTSSLAAGTWVYTNPKSGEGYTITLTSEAGVVSSAKHVAPADENGRPTGISVDSDASSVTLTRSELNINATLGTGATGYNLNDNIIFSADTPIGKAGLHIDGVDSGTKLAIGNSTYYFAQLDDDTDNGFEFTPYNANWKRTTDGWSYTDSTTSFNIAMSIASIIDPVETSDNATLVGSPKNVVITSSAPTVANAFSDTFTFTGFAGQSSLIAFDSIVAGANGLHIIGLDKTSSFTLGTGTDAKVYSLKELNGNSSTGLELLIQDANWSLSNSGDNDSLRTWSYSGDNGLEFSINPMDSVLAAGLTEIDSNTGRPVGASVTTTSAANVITSQTVVFGVANPSVEANGQKTVSLDMVNHTLKADDITKLHFKDFADASVVSGSSYAYTTDTTKMFTINNEKYYLAEVDGNTDNGFELVKNDANWHRYKDGWYYNDTTNHVHFLIASDTSKAGSLLAAEKGDTVYSGKPVGVDVAVDKKGVSTITIDTGESISLVFSTATTVENAHIIYANTSGAANNPNSATVVYAATNTPTFQFAKFTGDTVGADNLATDDDAESTTYYLANTDNNTLTKEFVRQDIHWTRYDNGWLYRDTDAAKFSFFVTSTLPTVNADGTPFSITVNSDTRTISFDPDNVKWGGNDAAAKSLGITENLVFFGDNTIGAYTRTAGETNGPLSTHVSIKGYEDTKDLKVRYFKKDTSTGIAALTALTSESTVFGSGADSIVTWYQLGNADANTATGLELTYNGWADTMIGDKAAYLYQSGWKARTGNEAKEYTSFILSGSAFGKDATVEGGGNVKGFVSATKNLITFSDGDGTLANTVSDFKVDSFKVFGSGTTSVGSFVDNESSVVAYDNDSYSVTFTLRNVDKSADGSLELTRNGWYKVAVSNSNDYMIFTDTSIGFTLSSSATGDAGNLDKNNNLLPDVLENDEKNANFSVADGKATLNLKSSDTLKFTLANATDTSKFTIKVYSEEDGGYLAGKGNEVYSLEASGSDYVVDLVDTTPAQPSIPQFSANDAWTNTGYDIEDLLGGVTGTNADAAVSELDEIIDIKPLAAAAAASVFDPDSAFTEVGKDKTIQSLTYGARHKARK